MLSARGGGQLTPNVIQPQASNWDIQFGTGSADHPSPGGDGMWSLDIPEETNYPGCINVGCKYISVVSTPYTTAQKLSSITMTFRLDYTPGTQFNWELDPTNIAGCGGAPAHVLLYFQRRNDDWSTDKYRYWAWGTTLGHPEYDYILGSDPSGMTVTITTPLEPNRWVSVYTPASADPTAFFAAIQNVAHVGIAFGGGCAAGHGVDVSNGTAKFTLISYTLT